MTVRPITIKLTNHSTGETREWNVTQRMWWTISKAIESGKGISKTTALFFRF